VAKEFVQDDPDQNSFGKICPEFTMKKIPAGIIAFIISLLTLGMSFPMLGAVTNAQADDLFFWIFGILGVALIAAGRGCSAALDAWLGGIAGILLWMAFGGIGELDELFTHSGTLGFISFMTLYMIFRPGTRCDFHLAIQKAFKIESPLPEGGHWHAPHVALGVFWTVWIGHTLEKIAYNILGTHSWMVWMLLIGSLVSAPFLLYKMWKTRDWATAWARSLPVVVIIWVAVDILRKWNG